MEKSTRIASIVGGLGAIIAGAFVVDTNCNPKMDPPNQEIPLKLSSVEYSSDGEHKLQTAVMRMDFNNEGPATDLIVILYAPKMLDELPIRKEGTPDLQAYMKETPADHLPVVQLGSDPRSYLSEQLYRELLTTTPLEGMPVNVYILREAYDAMQTDTGLKRKVNRYFHQPFNPIVVEENSEIGRTMQDTTVDGIVSLPENYRYRLTRPSIKIISQNQKNDAPPRTEVRGLKGARFLDAQGTTTP